MSLLNLVIADGNGEKSVVPIDFSGGFTGDILGLLENAWAIVNPLVTGTLVGANVTLEADISGFVNAAASALSDVQEKATFVFKSVDGFLKSISLPTFDETKFVNSGAGDTCDLTNTDVAAFVAMMTDGVDDGAGTPVEINPTTSHGEDLSALVKTHQSWGKNRK